MKKIFLLIISSLLLAGCVTDGKFKKSANNKWFDRKGFHGSKRRPLYNGKYIDRAKHNVTKGDFDEEYDDEEEYLENLPPALKNRYIYEDMIEQDIRSEKSQRAKKRARYIRRLKESRRNNTDLGRGRDRIRSRESYDSGNSELRQELHEIKSLLDAARKDLVKYKCPIEEEDQKPPTLKHEVKPKKISEQDSDQEESEAQPLVNAKPSTSKVAEAKYLPPEVHRDFSAELKKPAPSFESYLVDSDKSPYDANSPDDESELDDEIVKGGDSMQNDDGSDSTSDNSAQ